jgi:hypothetical protein
MRTTIQALIISIALSGCAAPGGEPSRTVDGTSQDSTVESLRLMMNNSPPLDHCNLHIAVARIRLGDATLNAGNNLGQKLNGMTAQQVIDLSQQYPPLPLAQMQCIP